MTDSTPNLIGYWMPEKKIQKLNWSEFTSVCKNHGFELVKVIINEKITLSFVLILLLCFRSI